MNRFARVTLLASSLSLVTTWGLFEAARGDEAGLRDIPSPFAPFEYLIGRWRGQAVPKDLQAKQFKGWSETHSWAWIFTKGKPTGLAVTIEGGKLIAAGKLTYDPASKRYRLEAAEPKPSQGRIRFEGSLNESAKALVLERIEPPGKPAEPAGKLRVSVRPNANFIRYTMTEERQEPGAFQYTRMVDVGLTRDGESLAAGPAATERPKCIVTGGAATMTLTYEGSTFSICCTGCRDEFNDNPQKYVKKAALLLGSDGGKAKTNQPAPARVNRFEDAFAGDVADSTEPAKPASKPQKTSPAPGAKPEPAEASPITARPDDKPQAGPTVKKDAGRKAADLLRRGQRLEKTGKTTAALTYFRLIVKDYPASPAAKTAAARIKALAAE